jgi:hypothetical protein
LKISVEGLGEFELLDDSPLILLLDKIKELNPKKSLPVAFLTPSGEVIDWHTPLQLQRTFPFS